MHNFKLLSRPVKAAQIAKDGSVFVDGRRLFGDAGLWIVVDPGGKFTVWQDADFRSQFEPADPDAQLYLDGAILKPEGKLF